MIEKAVQDISHNKTILVVDDDATIRMVAAAHLRQQGYTVATAENGARLLEMFPVVRPDLIMLDVEMPVMNGFDACRKLRQMREGENVPVLMITGLEGDSSIEESYQVGATDFIAKPINWTLLKQRLRFMLRAVEAMTSLVESEARLAKAQSIARLGYWRWDLVNKNFSVSPELQSILKIPSEGVESPLFLSQYLAQDDQKRIMQILMRASDDPSLLPRDFEVTYSKNDDEEGVVRVQSELDRNENGAIIAIQGTLQDITEKRSAERKIQFLSRYDSLTGLQNRESFSRALDSMIHECVRGAGCTTLFLIDIDRFVRINDIFGYMTGNAVLDVIGQRLREFTDTFGTRVRDLRSEVSRWGSDTFALALCSTVAQNRHHELASELLEFISKPCQANGHEISFTASIGYARVAESGPDLELLVRNAENAIRHAKRQGRNMYRCYDPSMSETTERRMLLEGELRRALSNNQLTLHYQPRVHALKRHIIGAEALLRWKHPILGDVSPVEFIPLMEELGLIHEVGAWVLEQACQQLRKWHQLGHEELLVSINYSAVQFRDTRLAAEIQEVIQRIGVTPDKVEVELTESAIMEDAGQTESTLIQLKSLGLRIAVDDFGTGYSSLGYLRRFPLDTLKIDRTFIRDLPNNADDCSLTAAIIAMAESLNLSVVAEGVEYEAQAAFLIEKRCDEFQGFLFSRPVEADVFLALVESQII